MTTPTPIELLDAGLKATLVLALAALLARALRHASAATRHLVWTLAVAATLLLPSLRGLAPRWALPLLPAGLLAAAGDSAPSVRSTTALDTPRTSLLADAPAGPTVPRGPAAGSAAATTVPPTRGVPPTWADSGVDGPTLLFLVWLAGALTVALPLLIGVARVSWLGRRSAPLTDSSWTGLILEVAASLGLRRSVRLLRGPAGSMPMAWGVLRPVVLLPEGAASWPESKRRAVLTHELAHVRRHDCLTQALAHAACALYWFHPLAWLAARRLRVERELACDDLVLRSGASGPDYADQLLQLARFARETGQPSWAAVAMARPSQLEGRLLAILDSSLDRRGLSRRGASALVAATALLSVGLAGLTPWAHPVLAARPLETAPPEESASAEGDMELAEPSNAAGPEPAYAKSLQTGGASPQPSNAAEPEHELERDQEQERETSERGPTKASSEKVVAALGEALRDSDAEVRMQAVHSLGQLRAASATPALARALEDAEPEVRAQAAFTLGELRATGAAEALRKVLTADTNAEVRQQAAFALGQLRDEGAVQALEAAVRDKDADVRQQAVFALGELRATSAIPALTAAIQDADADVRQQAVFALGQIRAEGAVGPLLGALKDAQPDVREQAAFALGEIRSREAVPALIAALTDATADVRQQAAFALGQLGDGRASEALAAALKDADVDVRKQAAFALGQLED